MAKGKPRKITPRVIAGQIRLTVCSMRRTAAMMEYYGGFGEIALHGREMRGAANIASGWAHEIRRLPKNSNKKP